jgi:hypothetical protein
VRLRLCSVGNIQPCVVGGGTNNKNTSPHDHIGPGTVAHMNRLPVPERAAGPRAAARARDDVGLGAGAGAAIWACAAHRAW